MILSEKPMAAYPVPCSCGCQKIIDLPRKVRHVLRGRWRYKMELVLVGSQWGGVSILEAHHFQPRHRRARRFWIDTRPRRRRPPPRWRPRLTRPPHI